MNSRFVGPLKQGEVLDNRIFNQMTGRGQGFTITSFYLHSALPKGSSTTRYTIAIWLVNNVHTVTTKPHDSTVRHPTVRTPCNQNCTPPSFLKGKPFQLNMTAVFNLDHKRRIKDRYGHRSLIGVFTFGRIPEKLPIGTIQVPFSRRIDF